MDQAQSFSGSLWKIFGRKKKKVNLAPTLKCWGLSRCSLLIFSFKGYLLNGIMLRTGIVPISPLISQLVGSIQGGSRNQTVICRGIAFEVEHDLGSVLPLSCLSTVETISFSTGSQYHRTLLHHTHTTCGATDSELIFLKPCAKTNNSSIEMFFPLDICKCQTNVIITNTVPQEFIYTLEIH